jgi:hypothetical protein
VRESPGHSQPAASSVARDRVQEPVTAVFGVDRGQFGGAETGFATDASVHDVQTVQLPVAVGGRVDGAVGGAPGALASVDRHQKN